MELEVILAVVLGLLLAVFFRPPRLQRLDPKGEFLAHTVHAILPHAGKSVGVVGSRQ